MAKPRVFISSTYYDLKQTREDISNFLLTLGYDPIRNEEGNIPYGSRDSLENYCYREINNIDILVSIIGGRFGSQSNESQWSISNEELRTALRNNKQVYIFIDKNVLAEYEIYLVNKKGNITYKYADNVKIHQFIEEIKGLANNNNIKSFETSADILHYLKEQLAGLFQSFLDTQSKAREYNLAQKLEAATKNLENTVDSLVEFNKNSREGAMNLMKMAHPIVARLAELLDLRFGFWIEDYEGLSNLLQRLGWVSQDEYENSNVSVSYSWIFDGVNCYRLSVSKNLFSDSGKLNDVKYSDWKAEWVVKEMLDSLETDSTLEVDELPF